MTSHQNSDEPHSLRCPRGLLCLFSVLCVFSGVDTYLLLWCTVSRNGGCGDGCGVAGDGMELC